MAKKSLPGGKLNNLLNTLADKFTAFRSSKKVYLILLAAGLVVLAVYNKSWFVAAMVNNTPVTNLELQMKLNDQFRSQLLNQLINEKIITDEAGKNNAVPTESEIDQKIADLEKNVGGKEVLTSLLTQQGQTLSSLRNQVRVQLAISKLYDSEASVSAEEVTAFIDQNKDQLNATDSAGQEKEAYANLKNQKLSQIFSQKFQELKTKAKIQIF